METGDPGVVIGSWLRVLTVLALEADLSRLTADDKVGRKLQDPGNGATRRARFNRGALGSDSQ